MILQSLNRYYERQRANGKLLPEGFELKEIPFVVVLDAKGAFVQIDDTRSGDGKKRRAHAYEVPQGEKKTSKIVANLLWGTAEYALGIDVRGNTKRVAKQHAEFKSRLDDLHAVREDLGLQALRRFFETIDMSQLERSINWSEIRETNPLVSFRLSEDAGPLICERPAIVTALSTLIGGSDDEQGFCLVRGEPDVIERLHPAIREVWNAHKAGANIVSFNKDAFNSYGKKQGANAPIGRSAAYNYTSALNNLLGKESLQRIQVGSTSMVFWAAEDTPFVDAFFALFAMSPPDDPDRGTQAIHALHTSIKTGVYLREDGDTAFHVLGLASNIARISICFWHKEPVRYFAQAIAQHFIDIQIVRPLFEREHLPLFRLLVSVAAQNKAENIPPTLDGDMMRAILTQQPYPALLLQAAVRRCRAERKVTYQRAALLKASLNRLIRTGRFAGKELSVSLDTDDRRPAYCLGRLFFLFELLQAEAHDNRELNKTIADRYYGAASSTPSSVFPLLTRLHKHHLAKLHSRRRRLFEISLGEIFDKIAEIPQHLGLAEQGQFAIGYYQQRQHHFAGKRTDDGSASNDDSTKD
jgi:CRISPR-associated protein Csd1